MPSNFVTDVAIIGAGLAGLSAAVRLQSLGVQVLILEAQSHPGGRVSTMQLPKHPHTVELGATWFHGTEGNAAFDIALEAEMLQKPNQQIDEDISYTKLVLSTEGRLVTQGSVSTLSPDQMMPVANSYVDAFADLGNTCQADTPDRSVQEHLKDRLGWERMTATERSIFRCCDLLEATVNGCSGGTGDLSCMRWNDYITLDGDNITPPPGGMTSVVNTLLSKLHGDCLLLNSEVVSVTWDGEGVTFKPVVRLRSGGSVVSSCVIWTASLNVTKMGYKTGLFNPELPRDKVEALEGRAQGIVEKAIAVLEGKLEGVVQNCAMPIVWEDESSSNGDEECKHWSRGIYALTYDEDKQTVSFWPCGEFAEQLCNLSEQEARRQVQDVLECLYEQKLELKELILTNWGGNNFVRGSYSFPAVGCDDKAVASIASPLPCSKKPLLCFAGEATHEKYYSTMHGAIETGYREAERCASFLAASMKAKRL